jgi:hypothetical protein
MEVVKTTLSKEDLLQVAEVTQQMIMKEKAIPKAKRQSWEKKLVREYVANTYPEWLQWFNVRVGTFKDYEKTKMYAFIRQWADCIVANDKEVIIIEGKQRARTGVISQVEGYIMKFKETPEFAPIHHLPVSGEIVNMYADKLVEEMCEERGIKFTLYRPRWFAEYEQQLIQKGKLSEVTGMPDYTGAWDQ